MHVNLSLMQYNFRQVQFNFSQMKLDFQNHYLPIEFQRQNWMCLLWTYTLEHSWLLQLFILVNWNISLWRKLNNLLLKLLISITFSVILDITFKSYIFIEWQRWIELLMSQSMLSCTPFILVTFSAQCRNNILLQPAEKIFRCPKWVQCSKTHLFWASYILFWIRNWLYNFLLLSGSSCNKGRYIYIYIYTCAFELLHNMHYFLLIVTNSWSLIKW